MPHHPNIILVCEGCDAESGSPCKPECPMAEEFIESIVRLLDPVFP